jgi:SAM-dependent methyltransferase
MSSHLTDRNFWVSFWESKNDLVFDISPDYVFGDILGRLVKNYNIKSAIELGGFPGSYCIYLKKYYGLDTTLFDYFIHPGIVKDLLLKNDLKPGGIHIIEADLFKYKPVQKYDMVISLGLIEHFKDVKEIIQRHIQFLNPGGILFIAIPNFRSVNGLVQKYFDRKNYDKHNIDSMNPELLEKISRDLGLTAVKASYYGKFSVWLENKKQKPVLTKAFIKLVWYAGKALIKIFPFESRALSPYIILEAKNNYS